ncbi:MAG: ArsR/SmtB family transcription factor [Candidatus Thorarchaeota archaeon]
MTFEKSITWRSEFHKALSNPVRLQIVDFLTDGEQCQCDIFPKIGLSQSTVSAYLTQLVKAGILSVRRDGTRKLYRISDSNLLKMIQQIRKMAAEITTS